MKIVQVPMGEQEATELADFAKARQMSRADLIRQACRAYMERLRIDELDQQYELGYLKYPESATLGQTSASLAAEFLPSEDWS